jgi:hypothetical protein
MMRSNSVAMNRSGRIFCLDPRMSTAVSIYITMKYSFPLDHANYDIILILHKNYTIVVNHITFSLSYSSLHAWAAKRVRCCTHRAVAGPTCLPSASSTLLRSQPPQQHRVNTA